MIWTLIVGAILVAGIICSIVGNNLGYDGEVTCITGIILVVISAITLVAMTGMIIGVNVTADTDYQNALHEREMLEYRIEHISENVTGNEMIYNDIVEFNNNLRTTKKWASSLWTNWFHNQKIASMDYVELKSN